MVRNVYRVIDWINVINLVRQISVNEFVGYYITSLSFQVETE